MRYKTVYMPHPSVEGKWYDTEDEAWNAIGAMGCGFNPEIPCDMCQAEWEVFSEDEINETEKEMQERKTL